MSQSRDRRSLWILCVLPLFIVLFSFLGPYQTDSIYSTTNMAMSSRGQSVPGRAGIEPNVGITSFALGVRAARDLISGQLPLWDHYEGLGAPLLGGMQSAALFPPTLLLLLPHGQAIEQAFLQLIGGIGAYLFFRRFGLGATAALAGGLLYELNGVFAWLRNAIFNPVAFLPWLFLAVELLRTSAGEPFIKRFPAVCLGAVAGALALYAGFPEEVYLYGLLVVGWCVFRAFGLRGREAVNFAGGLGSTALLALALSAPLLAAFAAYLAEADVADHAGNGFYGQWLHIPTALQHLLPYVYGPIWASFEPPFLLWGGTGGYIGFAPAVAGFAALLAPGRRATKIFLAGWCAIAFGVIFGWPGIYQAFMLLPLVKLAACYRYLNASLNFCTIFLAALLLDELPSLAHPRRVVLGGVICATVCLAVIANLAWYHFAAIWAVLPGMKGYAVAGFAVAAVIGAGMLLAGARTRILAGILVAEAFVCFMFPFLSSPRRVRLDTEAIAFLQNHTGYQRIMGAIERRGVGLLPQWGAAFGVATLNYANIPVPARTVRYIRDNLDAYATSTFQPWDGAPTPEAQQERQKTVHEKLADYGKAGVKYVLAEPGFDDRLQAVYSDPFLTIYEIPDARPYAAAPGCEVTLSSHDRLRAVCEKPSDLLRLELNMRGWTATVNSQDAGVETAEEAFQKIALPAGASDVRFTYRPPGFAVASVAAVIAMLLMAGGCFLSFRTYHNRTRASGLP